MIMNNNEFYMPGKKAERQEAFENKGFRALRFFVLPWLCPGQLLPELLPAVMIIREDPQRACRISWRMIRGGIRWQVMDI